MLIAEQKTRQIITGNPSGTPQFLHSGEPVVRWLTGGTQPDAWVTFHPDGEQIIVHCAGCRQVIGHFPADPYQVSEIVKQIGIIRESGHSKHKPANWPRMNIR